MKFIKLNELIMLLLVLPLSLAYVPVYPPSLVGENNQYYTVIFDEESEATVIAKLTFQNWKDTELKTLVLDIPGQVQIINAVQEIAIKRNQEPYFYNYGYDYQTVKYSAKTMNTIEFTLPQPVKEQEKLTLFIYYKVKGYVEKDFLDYNFNFETIKSNYDVNYVRTSINVQKGLYLVGIDSQVNYVDNAFLPVMSAAMDKAMASEMTSLSQNLEYSPGLVEEASSLDPFENLQVSGEYSNSKLWLQRWKIVEGIVLGSVLLLGIFVFIRKIKLKSNRNKEIVFWGFLSAFSSLSALGIAFTIMNNLYRWIGYHNDELISLFLGFGTLIFLLAALIIPPVYLGKKYDNYKVGLATVLATIGWLFGLSLGYLLLVII